MQIVPEKQLYVIYNLRRVLVESDSALQQLLVIGAITSQPSATERTVADMEPIANLVKVSIPNYLSGLPIPDSIGGWFRLGVKDWLALLPPTALLTGLGYMSYRAFCPHGRPAPCGLVNLKVKKDVTKVVDTIDIEDISEKACFCRCWRSENWPYCDGTHGRHNNEKGDNVGPLVITNKKG